MNVAEILRDFRTKYQGTFVFTENPETGKEMLCKLDEVADSSERNAVLYLSSKEAGKLQLNLASSQKLLFKFPKIGTFQYGKDSLMVQRAAPHRQYTRGFYSNNHRIDHCIVALVPGMARPRWTIETVQAAFDGTKVPPEKAVEMLLANKLRSAALMGRWSLVQPFMEGQKDFGLIHGYDFVGTVDKDLHFTPHRGFEAIAPEAARALLEG